MRDPQPLVKIVLSRGEYLMRADDGTEFDALIPAFSLAVPHALH